MESWSSVWDFPTERGTIMLLNDYWPHYMTTCARLRECTLTGYESAWRLHCGPLAGLDMDELDSENIQAWLDGFERPGAARKSWGMVRASK